jgi:hypothetical protein
MKSVKNYGYLLKYASNELRNNYEIVMEAVKNSAYALQYTSLEEGR